MKKDDLESFQRGMAEAKAFVEGARQDSVVQASIDVRPVQTRTALGLTGGERDAAASDNRTRSRRSR